MKDARGSTSIPKGARTSEAYPLLIAELECGQPPGRVGVTFCPGKKGDSVFGKPWHRDLCLDLDVIHKWGAGTILTLIEADELKMLGVSDLGERVRERGMSWMHLPIKDLHAPGRDFETVWPELAKSLSKQLAEGGRVLVHCRGGLGRAGTVAACLLIEMGVAPAEAVRRVRRARPGAIETAVQERYVLAFRPLRAKPKAD